MPKEKRLVSYQGCFAGDSAGVDLHGNNLSPSSADYPNRAHTQGKVFTGKDRSRCRGRYRMIGWEGSIKTALVLSKKSKPLQLGGKGRVSYLFCF